MFDKIQMLLIMTKNVRFKQPHIAIAKLANYFQISFLHVLYFQEKF